MKELGLLAITDPSWDLSLAFEVARDSDSDTLALSSL
jgi:hypothetical protein